MQKHHSSSSYLSLEALLSVGLSRDIFMDSNKNKVEASISPSGTPMNSRWNPTKEQISMLENFYTQGVRTPSAEQIQQITARLKAYGQIEGKNVFYWFQNHKARQRQKQKQENLAYMNRHNYLHKIRPLYPLPPSPNVVCSPYYLSQHSEVGYYPQNQQISLPAGGLIRKRPRAEKIEKMKSVCTATEYQTPSGCFDVSMINPSSSTINNNCQETLPLFPLEPTGILQDKTEAICTFVGSPASFESTSRERKGGQTFYDFFSGHGSCYSD